MGKTQNSTFSDIELGKEGSVKVGTLVENLKNIGRK